ncbi:DNA-binding protein H-NS [Borreliella spielmanii]|uniref:DNA-binding protein H-NS n=1 Tax=Borreliella spielmanii TaxID=88916 RepID=A0ABR6P858_9SPIR|nr:fibronectin-binding protein RevA [Borreliella spielmanii]MBB6032065.1 DNA-binding protein H-NS [Borreliella spielmanii]
MKNKNLVKLFFISSLLLFIMACKAFMGGETYTDEKKEIDSLLSEVSKLNEKAGGEKFKEYKDIINQLKEKFKDISDEGLKGKLLKLENLFQDKLAAKLAALKAAKQEIGSITDTDTSTAKGKIWSKAKLVGVTVKFSGSKTTGNGQKMSKEAVEQIDKIIKFLEEGTN